MHPISKTNLKVVYPKLWPFCTCMSRLMSLTSSCCARCCRGKEQDDDHIKKPKGIEAQVEMEEAMGGLSKGLAAHVDKAQNKINRVQAVEKAKADAKKKQASSNDNRDPFLNLGFGLF